MGLGLANMGRFSEPALYILITLSEGEKHGYAMMEDIKRSCEVQLGPGTLYGALARLEKRGLIEPTATEDRRRPYRLTGIGARVLEEQLRALQQLATAGLERLATS
jgi:DNA-binding PadR family transcriptional regulator